MPIWITLIQIAQNVFKNRLHFTIEICSRQIRSMARAQRCPDPPFRSRIAICVHKVQRTVGRNRHRAFRWQRRDSYDNVLAETIIGLYKAELIHRRAPWKTKESLELATLEWVSWLNHHRLLEPISYIPPAEAEDNYYRRLACQTATTV